MKNVTEYKHPTRVFLTNWGFHDYKRAERFGKLIGMTGLRGEQDQSRSRVDLIHTDRTVAEALAVLDEEDFKPEHDYILISGSPVLAFIIGHQIAERYGTVKILFWEALYQDYLERTVKRRDSA